MKITSLTELCKQDFNLKFLNFIEMPQSIEKPAFSCISRPKKQDLLLYVNNCSTEYLTKNKRVLFTKQGDVVYIPTGSEYRVRCTRDQQGSSTLQINFHLFDSQNIPVILSDEILIFSLKTEKIKSLFEKLSLLNDSPAIFPSEQKSIMFSILSTIARDTLFPIVHPILQPAMDYIHLHYDQRPSVSEIAKLCYITPEYFRKLFEEVTGLSPVKYINKLRLEKAADYLIYSDLPISEIGEMLNYSTTTHFITQFKLFFKVTPLQYRTQYI